MTLDLTVPYHKQDTDYYCSAACAQMILYTMSGDLLDQDDLYNDIHGNSTAEGGWFGAPDGLQWTMNNRKPAGATKTFELAALASADLISRKIAWTIQEYRVAPIALVYYGMHWIVVRGFKATAAPAGPDDLSYSITGFYVNDPTPTGSLVSVPPPPHSTSDLCTQHKRKFIPLAVWQGAYMTAVNAGTVWLNKYVAICDPDIPSEPHAGKRQDADAGRPKFDPGERSDAPAGQDSSDLIKPDFAVRKAHEGLDAFGLAEEEDFKRAIEIARPAEPILVQRLDRIDRFYYIVPWQSAQGVTPLATLLDGRSGEFLECTVGDVSDARGEDIPPSKKAGSIFSLIARQDAAGLVIGKKVDLPGDAGRMRVRPEAVCLYPTLVWKPCRQSLSPLLPFYMFTVGDHRIYVRSDGAIFTALDDTGRGM
jgi:hypothetical protein